jgi:hypothetical protein
MTGYSITQQGPAKDLLPLAVELGVGILGAEPFKVRDDALTCVVTETGKSKTMIKKLHAGLKIPEDGIIIS